MDASVELNVFGKVKLRVIFHSLVQNHFFSTSYRPLLGAEGLCEKKDCDFQAVPKS
jgi:hypothetical protein